MVTIMLDKERHLKLDINGMIKFEEVTGKRIFGEKEIKLKDLSAKDFRALMWAMLVHEDAGLTLEEAGALISTDNMSQILKACEKGFREVTGEGEGGTSPL